MTREEAAEVLTALKQSLEMSDDYDYCYYSRDIDAYDTALTALREKAERERGCAYCVIGRRSPDARYCSNCGRKLTPALPEPANESEEVNPDSHQYVDNDSTNRRKSVKQKCRNLHSETAETCTLRCDYCGKYAKESDLTTEYTKDKYLICRRCKENA